MRYKYRFELTWATSEMNEASEFLKKLDLDLGEIGFVETLVFTSSKNYSVKEIKEKFMNAFDTSGFRLIHVEGGKVE